MCSASGRCTRVPLDQDRDWSVLVGSQGVHTGPSATAIGLAVARGRHRLRHDPPWVFDDPLALPLAGPVWRLIERRALRGRSELDRALIAWAAVRSRYTEDRLESCAPGQYVILGAGLDSFVWRRPDLARRWSVFEVDHPATQAWKRARAKEIGLPAEPPIHFVPVDFEHEVLAERLEQEGFRRDVPAFFSWLGVTMYLRSDAIDQTLRVVARSAPGSEVVLTYKPPAEYLDELGRAFDEVNDPVVAGFGEPMVTRSAPVDMEDRLVRCGLEVVDHPDHEAVIRRYFAGRPDGLRPFTAERLIRAAVPIHPDSYPN